MFVYIYIVYSLVTLAELFKRATLAEQRPRQANDIKAEKEEEEVEKIVMNRKDNKSREAC